MMPQKLMNVGGLLLSFSYLTYGSFFEFNQNVLVHVFMLTVVLMVRFDPLFFVNIRKGMFSKNLNAFNWKISLPCTIFIFILLVLTGTNFDLYLPIMFMCIINFRIYLELFLHHRNPEKYK